MGLFEQGRRDGGLIDVTGLCLARITSRASVSASAHSCESAQSRTHVHVHVLATEWMTNESMEQGRNQRVLLMRKASEEPRHAQQHARERPPSAQKEGNDENMRRRMRPDSSFRSQTQQPTGRPPTPTYAPVAEREGSNSAAKM